MFPSPEWLVVFLDLMGLQGNYTQGVGCFKSFAGWVHGLPIRTLDVPKLIFIKLMHVP